MIISGTGRAGTTFLMQLLTALGHDTGFADINAVVDEESNAGMEYDLRHAAAPYIVKSPWICDYLEALLEEQPDIVIDHAIIPMRDLFAAAESRRDVMRRLGADDSQPNVTGGLWLTTTAAEQENVLTQQLYKLIHTLAKRDIPVTLLYFPRLVHEPQYLYAKLKSLLVNISYEEFHEAFSRTARPQLVHTFDAGAPCQTSPS